jgi:hypothetical protein
MTTQHTPEPVIYQRPELIKAGDKRVRLGLFRPTSPEVDCYIIAAENLHALEQQRDELLAAGCYWRDVVEELPKEAQEVLFVRSGKVLHGAWIGGIFWHSNQSMAAAYWMPFPSPPTLDKYANIAKAQGDL